MTKVFSCQCDSTYQDKKYGTQQRVCNPTQSDKVFTCTVCGTVHRTSTNIGKKKHG